MKRLVLCTTILAAALVGCGKKEEPEAVTPAPTPAATTAPAPGATAPAATGAPMQNASPDQGGTSIRANEAGPS